MAADHITSCPVNRWFSGALRARPYQIIDGMTIDYIPMCTSILFQLAHFMTHMAHNQLHAKAAGVKYLTKVYALVVGFPAYRGLLGAQSRLQHRRGLVGGTGNELLPASVAVMACDDAIGAV